MRRKTTNSAGIVSFSTRGVRTHGERSFWLKSALSATPTAEYPRFEGHQDTDVCIIGGGFTGLWTALELKQRAPGTRVTLVEADICGAGASGRNGGFALTWWAHFPQLASMCGTPAALSLARRSQEAVAKIGAFCNEHGIPEAYRQSGWVWAATAPNQVGAWDETLALLDETGERPFERLSRSEIALLAGSPVHLDGIFEPTAATIQPALLARTLTRTVHDAGVEIYEHSEVAAIEYGPRTLVVLERGSIETEQVVLASGAWSAQIPEIGAGLVVVASDVIATEPVPERLAEIGMDRGVCVSDSRRLVHYYRPTLDGRMVFGKGGGTLARDNRITAAFDHPGRRTEQIRSQLIRTFPTLFDSPVADAWSGPVDYSLSGLPFFVRLRDIPSVVVCAGFSGDGVGPSRLAGELVAEMVAGATDSGVPAALRTVPSPMIPMPPEPLRYLGGKLVRSAIARKERIEDQGLEPDKATRLLASLDPTVRRG